MAIDFLIYGSILTIVGIGLFVWALFSFRKKRLIENVPTSKIRSIAMGLVEIYGEVVPWMGNILKSPFSQNDCVYYKYTIDELRSTGKSTHWITIKKGLDYDNFYLKDDTGMVLVDPLDAKIDIPADNEFKSSLGKDPPDKVRQFLQANNVAFEGRIFGINKTMRYTEYFIAPKDKLYIMGTATDNPFIKDASAIQGVEDVIIKKGKHEKFYFISDKHERFILRRLRFIVSGGFLFGSLLIIFGLILFIW
jgi:hypothetical protein